MTMPRVLLAILLASGVFLGYGSALFRLAHDAPCHAEP